MTLRVGGNMDNNTGEALRDWCLAGRASCHGGVGLGGWRRDIAAGRLSIVGFRDFHIAPLGYGPLCALPA